MKKQILLILMSLSIFACATNNNPSINTTIEKFDTEKSSSYSFKTQAILTEADLIADLTTLLKKNNNLILVNRVIYYKTNYPALFGTAMTNNPTLQSALKRNTAVMSKIKNDISFANFVNNIIQQVNVTTIAGSTRGFANGIGTNAKFNKPNGVAVDSAGNLFVADTDNNRIRKIDTLGNVTSVAGVGGAFGGFADGIATNAQFDGPTEVAVDNSTGNLFVADSNNNSIRKIDTLGNVTTVAGGGPFGGGFANGIGTNAKFNYPLGITIDSTGNLFVADTYNSLIRKIDTLGNVTTVAGSTYGFADGTSANAQFTYPSGVAVNSSGNLFVADSNNNNIRKIDTLGNVTTVAGNGVQGFADGIGTSAQFNNPKGVVVDSTGNLFVADYSNDRIRKIDTSGNVTTFAGSIYGFADGTATNAQFASPNGVAIDSTGNLFVADRGNNKIRKLK